MSAVKESLIKLGKSIKYNWIKLIICLMAPLLFGFLVEGLFNAPLLMNRDTNQEEIVLEQLYTEGFILEGGELVAIESGAAIAINFTESRYINKLYLDYTSFGGLEFTVTTIWDRGSGETSIRSFRRNANMLQEFTAISIGQQVYRVHIVFEHTDLIISQMSINNEVKFSFWRIFFVYALLFLLLVVFFFKEEFVGKEQRFFVMAGLLMGLVAILSMPPHRAGWDEEIHFQRSYSLSNLMGLQREFYVSPAVDILMCGYATENWPYHFPTTGEDRRHLTERFNQLDTDAYRGNPEFFQRTGAAFGNPISFVLLSPGYVSQAVFVGVGRLLQLPISMVFILGRLGNLLLYLGVGYVAIRRTIIGKKIMTALLLMPTPLFLATVYSYDASINVFIALGVACIFREIYGKEEKLSFFNLCLFVVSITIAALPKAIFAPLLLLALLIPKEKFNNKKQLILIRAGILGVMMLLLSTFVLPTLVATVSGAAEAADPRGGDTNLARQMRHIFTQPISYAVLMLRTMFDTFVNFTIGSDAMGALGHRAFHQFSSAPAILLTAVTLTESGVVKIKKSHKILIGLLLFGVSALIWTALYLAFTPVASPVILGVQGRYFTPLVLIGLLLINGKPVEYKCEEKTYNTLLFAFITLITMATFYTIFVVNNV